MGGRLLAEQLQHASARSAFVTHDGHPLRGVILTLAPVARDRVTNGAFHFWDATDDFSKTNMDLLFEGDRLYLHKATGYFGAVPMSITGTHLTRTHCSSGPNVPQISCQQVHK